MEKLAANQAINSPLPIPTYSHFLIVSNLHSSLMSAMGSLGAPLGYLRRYYHKLLTQYNINSMSPEHPVACTL